jgi:hypothetical protein
VPDKQNSIEHELIRTGTLVEFEIIDTRIEPTAAGDHSHVHLTLQIPEDDVESYAFALVYVHGLLSFHDGRPRGTPENSSMTMTNGEQPTCCATWSSDLPAEAKYMTKLMLE